jgi:hypothetical protein
MLCACAKYTYGTHTPQDLTSSRTTRWLIAANNAALEPRSPFNFQLPITKRFRMQAIKDVSVSNPKPFDYSVVALAGQIQSYFLMH